MNKWILITLIGCISLFVVYIVLRKFSALKKSAHQVDKTETHTKNPYHAVSIKPGSPACNAVIQIRHQRYLADQAKRFPLAECTQDECHCTYQHHDDRRSGIDRRQESLEINDVEITNEKRHHNDRRKNQEDNTSPHNYKEI